MPPKKQASADKKPSPPSGKPSGDLIAHYDFLVRHDGITDDPAQRAVVEKLQILRDELAGADGSLIGGLFRKSTKNARSLYIWGNVGRGKSMLMELFFDDVAMEKKRRVHFHAFMQEVHARIHELRQEAKGDPVALLAQEIAEATQVLCFDELQATDVADATLLFRLFDGLFEAGVVIVSTSNHPPATLYTGGVQRERFLKFIALLEEQMDVVSLSSPEDYRQLQMKSLEKVYFYPLGEAADAFVAQVLQTLGVNGAPRDDRFIVQGREVPFALYGDSIGRFSFTQLCESALGPADYLAIARRLKTVILTGIPALPTEKRNEAKRFVTLIDALYEHKVKVIFTATVPPEQIYADGDGAFEFKRTVSRLAEMQSGKYLQSDI